MSNSDTSKTSKDDIRLIAGLITATSAIITALMDSDSEDALLRAHASVDSLARTAAALSDRVLTTALKELSPKGDVDDGGEE